MSTMLDDCAVAELYEKIVKQIEFVDNFVQTFQNGKYTSSQQMCEFFNFLLNAIGVKGQVIKDVHVLMAFSNLRCCKALQEFKFETTGLKLMEAFVQNFFRAIQKAHGAMLAKNSYPSLRPTKEVAYLIFIWTTLCERIQYCERSQSGYRNHTRFSYAFAVMDSELLKHVHRLRVQFHKEIPLMDLVCQRLAGVVIAGILHPNSEAKLIKRLYAIFVNDIHYFIRVDICVLEYFYNTLAAESLKPKSTEMIIQFFYNILMQSITNCPDKIETEILVEYLLCEKMMCLYTTVLEHPKTTYNGKIIFAYFSRLLHYSKRPIELSETFLVSLVFVVFKMKDVSNREEVVKMLIDLHYITDELYEVTNVVQDIIVFCQRMEFKFTLFESFLQPFCVHLNHRLLINELISITNEYTRLSSERGIAAYMVNLIFPKTLEQLDVYKDFAKSFLENFYYLLKNNMCFASYHQFLNLFDQLDFDFLQNNFENFNAIIRKFEKHAIETFVNRDTLPIALHSKLMTQYLRCNRVTKSGLQKASEELVKEFIKVDKSLISAENRDVDMLSRCEAAYVYMMILKKLNIILRLKSQKLNWKGFCRRVADRVFNTKKYQSIIEYGDIDTEYIIYETLVNCLINIERCCPEDKNLFTEYLPAIKELIFEALRNCNVFTPDTAFRVTSYFTSFINLHIFFSNKNDKNSLKLKEDEYLTLIKILQFSVIDHAGFPEPNLINYVTQSIYDELKSAQICMMSAFVNLHSDPNINLPVHLSWKICIYYGVKKSDFDSHLEEVLRNLLVHHYAAYKSIMAQLVLNLYKLKLEMHVIERALRAHKKLILESFQDLEMQAKVQMDIVLSVMRMLKKILKVIKKYPYVNRLIALTHLEIFLESYSFEGRKINTAFYIDGFNIYQTDLTDEERALIDEFLKKYERD